MSEETYTRIAQAVVLIVFVLGTLYADPAASASAPGEPPAKRDDRHFADCAALMGIAQAHCGRHERMYEKCHAIRGEAHHECDRQFIVANPLDCSQLAGGEARACEQECDAVRACSAEAGRGFFRCVSQLLQADPRR